MLIIGNIYLRRGFHKLYREQAQGEISTLAN